MSAEGQPRLSEAEYLAAERASDQKHEYYGGHAVALAGGSAQHNSFAEAEGALVLPSVGCTLALADIYGGVRLTEE